MPVRPFTFAFRGLFFGRYGSDAEDFRLPTLYLGYPGLVRGYDSGSFESSECGCRSRTARARSSIACSAAASRSSTPKCAFPLWALFGGDNFYGPLPVEMAFFADSGVAWGQSNSQQFARGSNKEPVVSVGVAMRVNLFGFAVARDRLRPAARSTGPRLALAVQSDAGILKRATCYGATCNVLKRATCYVLRCRATCNVQRAWSGHVARLSTWHGHSARST